MSRSKKSIRTLVMPKPNKKEMVLAREGDVHQAAFLMAHRLKIGMTSAYVLLRPLHKYVHWPVSIEGLSVVISHTGDVEVRVNGLHCSGGIFSHHITASGIRHQVHREVNGCDERAILSKNRKTLKFKRCLRRGHC